jgi:hypothetical protein
MLTSTKIEEHMTLMIIFLDNSIHNGKKRRSSELRKSPSRGCERVSFIS